MLNDSYWKEYNDGERAILWSANGETLAYIQRKDSVWDCLIYPELVAENFYYNGLSTMEEVEWQVTLFINNKCNKMANQLHEIRDHLPSIHKLAKKARVIKTEE